MGTYGSFKTDPELETRGITLDLGDAGRFQLARAGGANADFAKTFQRITRPYRRAIQTESLDEKTSNTLLIQAYAESTVKGWEGVTDESGNPLPFTKANAIKLFTDLPWLFVEIRKAAEDAALYRAETLKVDAGN